MPTQEVVQRGRELLNKIRESGLNNDEVEELRTIFYGVLDERGYKGEWLTLAFEFLLSYSRHAAIKNSPYR